MTSHPEKIASSLIGNIIMVAAKFGFLREKNSGKKFELSAETL